MKRLTDDGATQSNVAAKVDITGDSEMVKLNDLGDLLEALLELLDLQTPHTSVATSKNK